MLVDQWKVSRGMILRGHRGKVLREKPVQYGHAHNGFELLEGPRPFSNLASRKIELLAGLKARGQPATQCSQ